MKKQKKQEGGHSFEDYFKRAISPMLVLDLLEEKVMYVYQMQQELAARSDGRYTISLLYPVLYRLQEQGYVVESGKEISEDNRVRNYYAITPAGREYLKVLNMEYVQLLDAVQKILHYEAD